MTVHPIPRPVRIVALALALALVATAPLHAQAPTPATPDLPAGKAKAASLCAACHGAEGISVGPAIPNLAGQRAAYLAAQLAAFKDGRRKNEVMNAIAVQLGPREIADVAAFYASVPGAAAGAAPSPFLPALAVARMTLPAGFPSGWTHYTSIDFADRGQVRRYWANDTALQSARTGAPLPDGSALVVEIFSAQLDAQRKPVTGADGRFVADRLVGYTGMERQRGWGADFPEAIRNEDWTYALFAADKSARSGFNQAECLACHKPLPQDSYLFTLKPLREVAARR